MAKVYADVAITPQFAINADMQAFSGSIARGNDNAQHQPDGVYYLGPGRTAGYAVFNLGADYRPAPGLKFFAQINNLFDTKYSNAAQLGVTALQRRGQFRGAPVSHAGDRRRAAARARDLLRARRAADDLGRDPLHVRREGALSAVDARRRWTLALLRFSPI